MSLAVAAVARSEIQACVFRIAHASRRWLVHRWWRVAPRQCSLPDPVSTCNPQIIDPLPRLRNSPLQARARNCRLLQLMLRVFIGLPLMPLQAVVLADSGALAHPINEDLKAINAGVISRACRHLRSVVELTSAVLSSCRSLGRLCSSESSLSSMNCSPEAAWLVIRLFELDITIGDFNHQWCWPKHHRGQKNHSSPKSACSASVRR